MLNQFSTKRREETHERLITWLTQSFIGCEVYPIRKHYNCHLTMPVIGHQTNDLNFIVTIKLHCIKRDSELYDSKNETLQYLQVKMLLLSFSYRRQEISPSFLANQFPTSLTGLLIPLLQSSRPHTLSVSSLTSTRAQQMMIWTWDHLVCEPLISLRRWLDRHDMGSRPNEWQIHWCQTINCQARKHS